MALNLTTYEFGSNSCSLSESFDHGGGRDWADPINLLPEDPFGMELTAAIFGWLEELEDHLEANSLEFYLCNGDWTDPIDSLPADPFGMGTSNLAAAISGWLDDLQANSEVGFGAFCHEVQDDDLEPVVASTEATSSRGPEEGVPHEVLELSLGYLGVQDLLSVQRVCKFLHSAVQSDATLWRCIHIDYPLSEKITDDALLRLTLKSQGRLQCLSLVGCSKITDDGLKMVLESNPILQKLSVHRCVRLSLEGLICNLNAFKSSGADGIKQLKLGRLFSVSPEQYNELQTLLGGEKARELTPSRPRYYHCDIPSIACDDDRVLDIEICPGCRKFKLVFDCTSDGCQRKGRDHCRGCEICIVRCVQCGRCFRDCEFIETFVLDYLCLACWEQDPLARKDG